MKKGSSWFDFSLGVERTIEIGHLIQGGDKKHYKVIWKRKLSHGSLLKISAIDNRTFFHQIPPEKDVNGVRFSIVFRTIDMFDDIDLDMAN